MSVFIDYLVQYLPIIIGIIIFLLASSVKLTSPKVRIHFYPKLRDTATPDFNITKDKITIFKYNYNLLSGKIKVWHDLIINSEDMQYKIFSILARDTKIINRSLKTETDNWYLPFENFTLLFYRNIHSLHSLPRFASSNKLALFITDKNQLLRSLLSANPSSGILLAYLINYNLELISDLDVIYS